VILLLVYTVVMRRRGMAATPHATVGALANRLGLQVMEGDPTLNLHYLSQPTLDYKRRIVLEGAPHGRPLTWEFSDGTRTQDYVFYVRKTHSWGCFLVARVGVPIADFEVVLRQPTQYLEPHGLLEGLGEVWTGHPDIDATFKITSSDARVAALLAPMLRLLMGKLYVHIAAQGSVMMMPLTRYAMPYFVHDAEAYTHALESLCCALEGRAPPPPPQLGVSPAAA
jgi:hypothetical protein